MSQYSALAALGQETEKDYAEAQKQAECWPTATALGQRFAECRPTATALG